LLFISSKSHFLEQYESFLEIAREAVRKEKVGVLHVQDAVAAVTAVEYCKKALDDGLNLYVLKEDCQARGLLEKVTKNVEVVTYKGWVKLVADEYKKIVS